MAWHDMALNLFPMTAYLMKNSVPGDGILEIFHKHLTFRCGWLLHRI